MRTRMTHVVVYRESCVLRAAHLAVLVAFPELEGARGVPELARLGQQFRRVLEVDEEDVVDPALVEEGELVKAMGKLLGGMFSRAFEPFDAFLWPFREPEVAVQLGRSETIHGTRMEGSGGFPNMSGSDVEGRKIGKGRRSKDRRRSAKVFRKGGTGERESSAHLP
jgi:hypothetical protein